MGSAGVLGEIAYDRDDTANVFAHLLIRAINNQRERAQNHSVLGHGLAAPKTDKSFPNSYEVAADELHGISPRLDLPRHHRIARKVNPTASPPRNGPESALYPT